jgi:hypothetical protein
MPTSACPPGAGKSIELGKMIVCEGGRERRRFQAGTNNSRAGHLLLATMEIQIMAAAQWFLSTDG